LQRIANPRRLRQGAPEGERVSQKKFTDGEDVTEVAEGLRLRFFPLSVGRCAAPKWGIHFGVSAERRKRRPYVALRLHRLHVQFGWLWDAHAKAHRESGGKEVQQ